MSNQPKKKAAEDEKEKRVHPFDAFWQFHKEREEKKSVKKEKPSEDEKKRPFWF